MKINILKLSLLVGLSGFTQALIANPLGDVVTTQEVDGLMEEEFYWSQKGKLEEAKGKAIKLQIQNKNLVKVAGVKEVIDLDGNKTYVGSSDDSTTKSVNNLKEFLSLSIEDKIIIKPEQSKEQEQEIAASSFQNIAVAGEVDVNGNLVRAAKGNDQEALFKKQQLAADKRMLAFQGEFMNKLTKLVDSKIEKFIKTSDVKHDTTVSTLKLEPSKSKVTSQMDSDLNTQVDGLVDEGDAESPFYFPTGKIKKVTPLGVEIVLGYKWKDFDEDTIFVSAIVNKEITEIAVYPMVRYKHQYKVVTFSESYIVLSDNLGQTITISR